MQQTKGFSLIEVLVSLVLISIGILGMVTLQGRTQELTQDSIQRSSAALLADELIEQIRANPKAILSSKTQLLEVSSYYKAKGTSFPAEPASPKDCTPYPNTPDLQLGCWKQKALAQLPDASTLSITEFYICRSPTPKVCDSTKGSAIEIQIAWRVKKGMCLDPSAADETICTFRARAEI